MAHTSLVYIFVFWGTVTFYSVSVILTCDTILYDSILQNTSLYHTTQYNTIQYSIIQYNTTQPNPTQPNPTQHYTKHLKTIILSQIKLPKPKL